MDFLSSDYIVVYILIFITIAAFVIPRIFGGSSKNGKNGSPNDMNEDELKATNLEDKKTTQEKNRDQ